MVGESLAWGSTIIFLVSVLSRFLGLLRETLIAFLYGTGAVTDSFVVASVLPTTLAGLIGGALTTVFISVFVEERERLGEARAWEGLRAVLGTAFLVLGFMLGLTYFFVPYFL
ncbi:MAG: hypothetical protein NZ651_07220, partial [Candidatus Bipolaricaulota bacterium]|nr:hypothetical protein [Candidatus Bipolaricaulota bacterium]MDW8127544.1 lipid II flippase MurJ [Candidatus Bipolaricaulota bacterium]